MTNPFVIWLAQLLDIDPGFVVMGLTIAVIFGYMFAFAFLLHVVRVARYEWDSTSNPLWLLVLLVVGAVTLTLSLIHLLITLGGAAWTLNRLFGDLRGTSK